MSSIALINDDTNVVVLTLDGIDSMSVMYDGQVTTRPVSDRSDRTDGRIIKSTRVSLGGNIPTVQQFSPTSQVGWARVQQVRDALLDLRQSGTPVTIYQLGEDGIPSMQVERFSIDRNDTYNPPISVDLVERRLATSRTVNLAPVPRAAAPVGPPPPAVAAGQAAEVPKAQAATRPTSWLVSTDDATARITTRWKQ